MAQHKIQSSTGLTLELQQVPKMLDKLVNEWAPRAFVVSFKLETDESILFAKAWGAIEKYNVHLVVANILHTRADKCYLVEPVDTLPHGSYADADRIVDTVDERQRSITTVQRSPNMSHIEPALVHKVVQAYWAHLGHKQLHGPAPKSTDGAREECIFERVRQIANNYVQMVTYAEQSEQTASKVNESGATAYVFPVFVTLLCLSGLGLAYYAGTLHSRDFKR